MLKFFNPKELDEMEELPIPKLQQQAVAIRKQELDDKSKKYTLNYRNCMLCFTHKNKHSCNIYIPGIIWTGLCYTMPLVIPSGLQPSDSLATIFNSQEKAYQDDKDFMKSCNLKAM